MPSLGYGYSFDAEDGARKLEKAYLRTPPGMRELLSSGNSLDFGADIRPKRSKEYFLSSSTGSVPTCGFGVEDRVEPGRYWAPGPGSYDPQTCRFGGARLGQDSPYANYSFSQADNGPKDGPIQGRASVIKEPHYGSGRLGGLKGLQTPVPAEALSPGPKYLLRSEPHLNKKVTATDVTCTYGPRHNFDKVAQRSNSQDVFATQYVKGLGGGFGRDSCLDHPGPADYSAKCNRGGGGYMGDSPKFSFRSCRPHDAYGRPGKTRMFSEQHSGIDNFGIFTPGPAHYNTQKVYQTSRTQREPDASRLKYTFRPKLTMEFDAHVKKATNPGPGVYDPACSRTGKTLSIEGQKGVKIGSAKKMMYPEESTIPYVSTQHEVELAGKFSPGPVYDPPNQSIAADAGITNVSPPKGKPTPSSRSKGFTFGSSSRFEKDHGGFESGHLWERKPHTYQRERSPPKVRKQLPAMEGTEPVMEDGTGSAEVE